ncbi:MAG: hypothetical protein FIA82_05675 [Melioribacter sp.]|nr:hypothetical protein [Melioribacter sp.]
MSFSKKYFSLSFKSLLLLLLFWLMSGYVLGTALLIGPVRWIADYSKMQSWPQSTEDIVVKIVMVILVILSFIISLFITRSFLRSDNIFKRIILFILPLILSAGAVWLWMNPSLMQKESNISETIAKNGSEFVFGSFPEEAKIRLLKEKNFTAIISLMHEAVVPFEPKLIKEEKESCKNVGIEIINIPMLPWISENKEALNRLKDLALHKPGKYYVHCYLGKDRVNIAKRVIETSNQTAAINSELKTRSIEDLEEFERGAVIKLEKDVYFTPFPTDDEFMGYILNGSFKNVVSLLDPKNPEDLILIEKEKNFFETFKIPFENYPLRPGKTNKRELENEIKKIMKTDRPILIHAFKTNSPQSEMFISAYNSSKTRN